LYDPVTGRGRPLALARLIGGLRQARFDWAFTVHASRSAALAVRLAGIPWRTCIWRYGRAEPPAWHGLSHQGIIQDRRQSDRHEVESNLEALGALGVAAQAGPLHLPLPAAAVKGAQRALAAAGIGSREAFAVLHPGHAGGRQEWPA